MNKITTYITLALSIMLLAACDSQEALSSNDEQNMIHVGGVNTDPMVTTATVTRSAVAAETLDWLKEGLTQGMNMQYYKEASAKQKAILKLEADGTYSMKTPDGIVCKWLGNGKHAFEGVYVPSGLNTQNTTQNYDDLIHYTAIPPSTEIAATVGKITIPLQHRLARVLAYVLIDQSMNAKLKGYDASNYNAEETKLRFCKYLPHSHSYPSL